MLDDDRESSDSGDGDLPVQADAKLRARLRRSIANCKALRAELDKSIENTNLLDATIRERAHIILRLSHDSQKHASALEELHGRIRQSDAEISALSSALSSKSQALLSLSTASRSLGSDIDSLNVRLASARELEARLFEGNRITASLASEVDALAQTVAAKDGEFHCLRRSVLFRAPGETALLLGTDADPRLLGELRELNDEVALLRTECTPAQAVAYNRARLKFGEVAKASAEALAARESALKAARERLQNCERTSAARREELAAQERELGALLGALDKQRGDFAMTAGKREKLDAEFMEVRREWAAVERKSAAVAGQIARLEALRQSRAAEFAKAESALLQREELLAKDGALLRNSAGLSGRIAELERAKAQFQEEQWEIVRLVDIRKESAEWKARLQNASESDRLVTARERLREQKEAVERKANDFAKAEADYAARLEAYGKQSEALEIEKEKVRDGKARAEKRREAGALNRGYLKKVFLQFFLQEESKRRSLIPVLLELVDCSEEEVQLALRKWNDSQQVVSRSFWPF